MTDADAALAAAPLDRLRELATDDALDADDRARVIAELARRMAPPTSEPPGPKPPDRPTVCAMAPATIRVRTDMGIQTVDIRQGTTMPADDPRAVILRGQGVELRPVALMGVVLDSLRRRHFVVVLEDGTEVRTAPGHVATFA